MDVILFLNTALLFQPGEQGFLHWSFQSPQQPLEQVELKAWLNVEGAIVHSCNVIPELVPGELPVERFLPFTVPEQSGHYLLSLEVSCRDSNGGYWQASQQIPAIKVLKSQGVDYQFHLENAEDTRLVDMVGSNAQSVAYYIKNSKGTYAYDGSQALNSSNNGPLSAAEFNMDIDTSWRRVPLVFSKNDQHIPDLAGQLKVLLAANALPPQEALWQLAHNSDTGVSFTLLDSLAVTTGQTPQQAYRLGKDSIQMAIQSFSGGYLTLINLGTSGDCTLIVPNYFSSSASALLAAHELEKLPGGLLLPIPEDELRTQAAQGEERIIALVTTTPIIPEAWLHCLDEDSCFTTLDKTQWAALLHILVQLPTIQIARVSFSVI